MITNYIVNVIYCGISINKISQKKLLAFGETISSQNLYANFKKILLSQKPIIPLELLAFGETKKIEKKNT